MKMLSELNKHHMTAGIPKDYIEKVYAGMLGKVIGVRHGGNIEGWTYDQIRNAFGEVTTYLHEFKNFAADDDTNGPMFFLRALEDYTHTSDITAEQMGLTWLNYVPENHGFFWWGGYGTSSEHTAFHNLKNGIMAPRSGSIEQNGSIVAEQIGGQIFIDVWGMIAPGNPQLAADYAEKIASVSHDRNGKYGGMFIAACIAKAFVEKDVKEIIQAGQSVIPEDCEYSRMTNEIINFYSKNKENWRDCFAFVHDNFGYDRYPGNCHIIPNSAVIILSLLYSEGDFSQAINICNMCGWDTDCNVANVGAIMGVRVGISGIDFSWREPINDFLCCSSVIGTLNMLEIPWCATYIANLGYKIAKEPVPEKWKGIMSGKQPQFHFEYPGSTHAFRIDTSDDDTHVTAKLENTTEAAASGSRSLKVFIDRVKGGKKYRLFYKTYYRPDDFNDSRYDPSFSPQLYPGQSIKGKVMVPANVKGKVKGKLYVKDGYGENRFYGEEVELTPGQWLNLTYDIPEMKDVCIEEFGIELIPLEGSVGSFFAYLDDFHFDGEPHYSIDFTKSRQEKWNDTRVDVSQFTYLRGLWSLEAGVLSGSYSGEPSECYSGDLKWKDYSFEATVIPKLGHAHNILFRVQGGIRSYAVGFAPDNQLILYKNDNGYQELISTKYLWRHHSEYLLKVVAVGNEYSIYVNNEKILDYKDIDNPYLHGQIGFSNFKGSRTNYRSFSVEGV
jgi:ADP-ribosylglycohydrolase